MNYIPVIFESNAIPSSNPKSFYDVLQEDIQNLSFRSFKGVTPFFS